VGAAAAIAIAIGMRGAPVTSPVPPPTELQASETLIRVRQVADRVRAGRHHTPLDTGSDNLILDSKRGLDAVLATGGLR